MTSSWAIQNQLFQFTHYWASQMFSWKARYHESMCQTPLQPIFVKKKEKSLSTKSKGHHLLWQERLVTCFRSEFLRKDRKSELPSLICFLSRLNQEFLNRNRKIHPPAHFNRCSQERPQPREHINTAVTVWTFVCFCLNMDRHLSKGHPKAQSFLHQSAILWIFIYDWNIWHVTTYFILNECDLIAPFWLAFMCKSS